MGSAEVLAAPKEEVRFVEDMKSEVGMPDPLVCRKPFLVALLSRASRAGRGDPLDEP